MRTLLEFFFLWLLYELSVHISYLLPFSIPPALIGMGILLLLFMTGILHPNSLQRSSQLINRHTFLFFIPIIVGIMQYWKVLLHGGWYLMVTIVFSTVFVLIFTGMISVIFRKSREIK
ncbi:CidA/LrgA family protein [Neobacillus mesonae]|uniref:CidA/LrgA family protein n=1 Tax=Neobacillus mesonae TaxID=1193713 RepID=UPI00203D4035|nr:CidA/LrgA family protein [Neobacillus mesonae]MCM3569241.1 CidA/LrgA family protein [Neobacillus mesonae]